VDAAPLDVVGVAQPGLRGADLRRPAPDAGARALAPALAADALERLAGPLQHCRHRAPGARLCRVSRQPRIRPLHLRHGLQARQCFILTIGSLETGCRASFLNANTHAKC